MQGEVDAVSTTFPITIIGVNEVGFESGNDTFTAGRDIPWLQETSDALIWDTWNITSRDVVVLDESLEVVAIFNVTTNGLADPANYDALKTILLDTAGTP